MLLPHFSTLQILLCFLKNKILGEVELPSLPVLLVQHQVGMSLFSFLAPN